MEVKRQTEDLRQQDEVEVEVEPEVEGNSQLECSWGQAHSMSVRQRVCSHIFPFVMKDS